MTYYYKHLYTDVVYKLLVENGKPQLYQQVGNKWVKQNKKPRFLQPIDKP